MPQRQHRPHLLVQPAWLAMRLGDPTLRVIDCTVGMTPRPVGASIVSDGRAQWAAGHIPGAAYLHMTEDLSAPREGLPYNLPPPARMTALLAALGINQGSTIVLYGGGAPWAVTRAWWVLRASGVADVRILDGGWQAWLAGGHPVSTEEPGFPPGDFLASPMPGMVAGRDAVLAATRATDTCLVNALSPQQFLGTGGAHYGRPGRIPGSVSVPSQFFLDPASGRFRPLAELEVMFAAAGVFEREKVIAYCGGGIAASATAFVLEMLGHPAVALYDASLLEWSNDPALPMAVGEDTGA